MRLIPYLPLECLMDTVYFHNGPLPLPPYSFYGKQDPARENLKTVSFTKRMNNRLFCSHVERQNFVRIDHRAGPGSFADNYEGSACTGCGKIFEERRTN